MQNVKNTTKCERLWELFHFIFKTSAQDGKIHCEQDFANARESMSKILAILECRHKCEM